MRRLAILPLNILVDEPTQDEMRGGGAFALQQDLLRSPNVISSVVQIESGGYAFGATESVWVAVSRVAGRLHGDLTERSLATGRTERVVTADANTYIELMHQLALSLDDRAGPFSTKDDGALRVYVRSLQTTDRTQKVELLEQAIRIDAHFGAAYLSLAELLSDQPLEAARVLEQAKTQSNGFTALDRARLQATKASLSEASLTEQARAIAGIVELAPNDVDSLLALGITQFLTGEGGTGEASLRKATKLSPERVDIRHQLALGLLAVRRFADAAEVLRSLPAEGSVPTELASCLLLKGDVAGANKVMNAYFTSAHNQVGPALPLIQANWVAVSRGLAPALASLRSETLANPDLVSIAASQGAIWSVALGQQPNANQSASAVLKSGGSRMAEAYGVAAITAGSKAPGLESRLDSLRFDAGTKAAIAAYTLFLQHRYAEAAIAWAEIAKRNANKDLRARAMLAASLDRAGRGTEMSQIVVQPFAPNLLGADPYAAISFSEMRRLLKL